MASKLSIRRTIAESYDFALHAALPSLPWLLLFAAGMLAYEALPAYVPDTYMALVVTVLGAVVASVTGLILSAKLYHFALPAEEGASLIADSWRLLLANAAILVLVAILFTIATVFFSIMAGLLIDASGYDPEMMGDPVEIVRSLAALSASGGGLVLYVMLAVAAIAAIWLMLRLALFRVATIARQEVTVFRSWSWTRGYVLRLLVICLISIVLPFGIATMLNLALFEMLDGIGLSLITTFIMTPYYLIGHGMAASVYRQIGPLTVDVDATFG